MKPDKGNIVGRVIGGAIGLIIMGLWTMFVIITACLKGEHRG